MKHPLSVLAGLVTIILPVVAASAQSQTAAPTVMSPDQVAVSQPLREVFANSPADGRAVLTSPPLPRHRNGGTQDEALQSVPGLALNAAAGPSFPGMAASGSAPPGTNMAVGPNHILQTVNSRYAIYSKSGTLLVGPNSLRSLWAPLVGNPCAIDDGGDVVAQYDTLADRFIVTERGGISAPFSECIAISQTPDPAGAYWLYSYPFGSTLNGHPTFAVWPTATNGAYLASYNLFADGTGFTGSKLCAYDRTKMLVGDPSAQGICYTVANDGGYLPADLDGSTPPLNDTPGLFLNYQTTLSSLRLYALKPHFASPSSSVLSLEIPDIPVASFAEACAPSFTCVPQLGTSQELDSLGDHLMDRLTFRNFGDHEALVVNHSVASGATVGVRWYELRAPVSTSGPVTLYQQGTFAPDATFRWMGSAAMDAAGNVAVGYSASSRSMHPAIRLTGRMRTDPLGTLEAEVSLIEGTGSQTSGLSRWGGSSAMRIDPSDDCTFWYANQYQQADGAFDWSTFVGSFKFSSCSTPLQDPLIAASPSSPTVGAGPRVNVALATNGGVASASSSYPASSTAPAAANDGDRTGKVSGVYHYWNDNTIYSFPDWLEIDFTGAQTLDEIDVFTVQDTEYSTGPVNPTLSTSAVLYGIKDFAVQYWTGSAWTNVPGGTVTGNTHAWNQFTFAPISTTKIRVFVTSAHGGQWSAVTEVEAYASSGAPPPDFSIAASPSSLTLTQAEGGTSTVTVTAVNGFSSSVALALTGCPSGASCSLPTPVVATATSTLTVSTTSSTSPGLFTLTITGTSGALSHATTVSLTVVGAGTRVNVALVANGGVASASSSYPASSTVPAAANDGDRTGKVSGVYNYWNDNTLYSFPDWLQIDFAGTQTINEIDVFTLQDTEFSTGPVNPTLSTSARLYGIRDFTVQYWTGSTWAAVAGGTVSGNTRAWNQFTFAPISTTKIRVFVTSAYGDQWSAITEVEAYADTTTPPPTHRAFPDTSATIAILVDQLPALTPAQQRTVVDHFVGTQKLALNLSGPLRALKPDFLVLHYHLAIWQSAPGVNFIIDGRTWGNDYPEVNTHESWFWHNLAGQRVASTSDGKLLMNIGDPAFATYWADSIAAQVRAGDYDGVFADSASPALLQGEAQSPPEPRLSGTGARDTPIAELGGRTYIQAWQSFMTSLDASLAAQGVPLIPNTGPFITTWDTTRYDLTAGAFVEGFANPGFGEADWRASTDHLLALAAARKIIILQNYLGSTADLARRRYYLANYLLVKGDRTYLDYFAASALEWYPEWGLDLGRALTTGTTAASLAVGGIYRRDFERGTALVNPTNVPVLVTFASPMRRVEPAGGGVIDASGALPGVVTFSTVSSIVVPANGAEILLK